jgi:hypothetical protein
VIKGYNSIKKIVFVILSDSYRAFPARGFQSDLGQAIVPATSRQTHVMIFDPLLY